MACEFRGRVGLKMFKFKWGAAVEARGGLGGCLAIASGRF